MCELGGFFEHFSILRDPSVDRTRKHNVIGIVLVGVCTITCGGEGFTDMEDSATAEEQRLRKYFESPGGHAEPRHFPPGLHHARS